MLFQGMFFIITPALICGAFAERMKFSTMVRVLDPLGHAGLLPAVPLGVGRRNSGLRQRTCGHQRRRGIGLRRRNRGAYQFRRLGPALRLVARQAVGLRQRADAAAQFDLHGHGRRDAVGGLVRLQRRQCAWRPTAVAASAFAATHFAAAAGGLAWAGMEWITRGKPSVLGTCSGVVAGLVCITPASGYVQPMPAIAMGVAAGVVCFLACTKLKGMFRYDDSLDAFGVHGVGGTLGAILTGVFATRAVNDVSKEGKLLGLLEGGNLLTAQILARADYLGSGNCGHVRYPEGARRHGRTPRLPRGGNRGPGPQPTRRRRVHLHLAIAPHVGVRASRPQKAAETAALRRSPRQNSGVSDEENRSHHPALQAGRRKEGPQRARRLGHDDHGGPRVRPPERPHRNVPRHRIRGRFRAQDQGRGRGGRRQTEVGARHDHALRPDRPGGRRQDLRQRSGRSDPHPHR